MKKESSVVKRRFVMDRKAFICAVIGGVIGMVFGTFFTLALCWTFPIGTVTGRSGDV